MLNALEERLHRVRGAAPDDLAARLQLIVREAAALPDVDGRPVELLVEYDANGLPT